MRRGARILAPKSVEVFGSDQIRSVLIMTQQYIRGELSLRLGALSTKQECDAVYVALIDLRQRVECAPLSALPDLAAEAMDLVDAVCLASLEKGDLAAFDRECRDGASLHVFATCAGLLP